MTRDYRKERNWLLQTYYGPIAGLKRRLKRSWPEPISETDYAGIPTLPNNPLSAYLPGDCMVWLLSLNVGGYGTLSVDGKSCLAHRVAYMQVTGKEIPDDLKILHKCHRPYCVQPAHLYAGTAQDNRDDFVLFDSGEWFSAVERVTFFPDRDWPEGTLEHRIKASRRNDVFAIWESPDILKQTKMLDIPCPGHNFTIPAGDSKVCRMCGAFESRIEDNPGLSILAIGQEIYPVTQWIETLLEAIGECELTRDEYGDWRENVSSRCGILTLPRVGEEGHLPVRFCQCLPCQRDRAIFREKLQPCLTSFESEILDACDRIEPAIRESLEQARGNALAAIARTNGWLDDEVEALREHIPSCVNSASDAKGAADFIEGALGFALYSMQGSVESFRQSVAFKYRMLSGIKRLIASVNERDTILVDEVQRATKAIIGAWETETRSVRDRYIVEPDAEAVGYALESTRLFIASTILEQLRYDCFSSNSFSSQWPHVHRFCIDETRRG